MAGTYAEKIIVQQSVRIEAYPGESVTITPAAGVEKAAFEVAHSGVTLKGITIDATNRRTGVDVYGGVTGITFEDCTFQHCAGASSGLYGQGAVVDHDCTNVTFRGCTFDDIHGIVTEEQYCHGIYCGCFGVLVEDCTFTNVSGNGFNFYGNTGSYLVQRNYFESCGAGVGIYHGDGVAKNNVIRDCDTGIIGNENIATALMAHNTIIGCAIGLSANSWGDIQSLRFVNNLVQGSVRFAAYCDTTGAIAGTVKFDNNVFSDTVGSPVVQLLNDADQAVVEDNVTVSEAAYTDDGAQHFKLDQRVDGAEVGVVDDFDLVARSSPPSVGAFE